MLYHISNIFILSKTILLKKNALEHEGSLQLTRMLNSTISITKATISNIIKKGKKKINTTLLLQKPNGKYLSSSQI